MERLRLAAGARLASLWIRFLVWTNERRYQGLEHLEDVGPGRNRYILALWHEHLLLMLWGYRGPGITPMISLHRDGEWIARTLSHLGVRAVRGSTTRGGSAALRSMIRTLKSGRDLAFTPDGPRGPRRKAQLGVVQAARLSGAPILPGAMAATHFRRLSSWDRFLVPLPFGKLFYVYGEPIRVSRHADAEEMERARARLEEELTRASRRAELLAAEAA